MCKNEIETKTHGSRKREPKERGSKKEWNEGNGIGHETVLLVTY
jgi:hypothetical protein